MAATTRNLKLRLSDDLTADARYNLQRIDQLAGTFSFAEDGVLNIDGGSNGIDISTTGPINFGSADTNTGAITLYSSSIDFSNVGSISGLTTAWNDINFTGSDLSDIETKSHTVLGDIGVRTHAELDALYAAYVEHDASNNEHGVSGDNVGTEGAQTLSDKTLDNSCNISALYDDITGLTNDSIAADAGIEYSKLDLEDSIDLDDLDPAFVLPGDQVDPDFGDIFVESSKGFRMNEAGYEIDLIGPQTGALENWQLELPENTTGSVGKSPVVRKVTTVGGSNRAKLEWAVADTPILAENFVNVGDNTNTKIPTDTSTLGDIFADDVTGLTVKDTADINPNSVKYNITPTISSPDVGQTWWDQNCNTLNLQLTSDVRLQVGQEQVTYGLNDTGALIPNGSVIYINSASGGHPTFELADASNISGLRVIGVTTEAIADGAMGFATSRGFVRGLDTSTWAATTALFLSTTAGELSNALPVSPNYPTFIGVVTTQDASDGEIYVDIRPAYYMETLLNVEDAAPVDGTVLRYVDGNSRYEQQSGDIFDIPNDVERFTGFKDVGADSGTTLSYDDGTRTFTITPTASEFDYYIKGTKYTQVGADSVVWTDDHELHLIYYNGTTLTVEKLSALSVSDLFKDVAIIAYIYWDSNLSKVLGWADERHGANMSEDVHRYLHEIFETRYDGGLGLTLDSTDTSGDAPQLIVASGKIWDEDIPFDIPQFGTDASTDPAQLGVWYKEGAAGSFLWKRKAANDFPIIESGAQDISGNTIYTGASARPAYNQLTGGNWQLTEMGNNNYFNIHIISTDGYNGSTFGNNICVLGEESYNTVGLARDGATTEIAQLKLDGLPIKEWKAIGTCIVQSSNGANTTNAYFRSTDTGEQYVDFRIINVSAVGASNDHSALINLDVDSHSQYALLAGRSGGQILVGGTDALDDLTLWSTLNATKGNIIAIDELLLDYSTASRAVALNADKELVATAVTDTELGYVSGATSNLQAQINALGAIESYKDDWITGDGTTKAITHNLGSLDVKVEVYDKSNGKTIQISDEVRTNTNTLTVTASEAPGASGWRVLILAI